jgi:hypothetical protein
MVNLPPNPSTIAPIASPVFTTSQETTPLPSPQSTLPPPGTTLDRSKLGGVANRRLQNQFLSTRREKALDNLKSAAQEAVHVSALDTQKQGTLKSHEGWNKDSKPEEVLEQARQTQTTLKGSGLTGKALDDLDTAIKAYESAHAAPTPPPINTTPISPNSLTSPTSSTPILSSSSSPLSPTPQTPLSPNAARRLSEDLHAELKDVLLVTRQISPNVGAATTPAQLQGTLTTSLESMLEKGKAGEVKFGDLLSDNERKTLGTHLQKMKGSGSTAPTQEDLGAALGATRGQLQGFANRLKTQLEPHLSKLPPAERESLKADLAQLDHVAQGKPLYQPPPGPPPPLSGAATPPPLHGTSPPPDLEKPLPEISPEDKAHQMKLETLEKQQKQAKELHAAEEMLNALNTMFAIIKKNNDFIIAHLI